MIHVGVSIYAFFDKYSKEGKRDDHLIARVFMKSIIVIIYFFMKMAKLVGTLHSYRHSIHI